MIRIIAQVTCFSPAGEITSKRFKTFEVVCDELEKLLEGHYVGSYVVGVEVMKQPEQAQPTLEEERERCARIAENYYPPNRSHSADVSCGISIANAIRNAGESPHD